MSGGTAAGIPRGAALRVVGDVHGDARGFAAAMATDRFIVQLGDLTDGGPGSAEVLRAMLGRIASGGGLFVLGNHDFKLLRALAGRDVRIDGPLADTLAQLDDTLRHDAAEAIAAAPAWLRHGNSLFVHGGFHAAMLEGPPPAIRLGHVRGPVARALYGEPTGRLRPDGHPERSLRWADRIPAGITVYCGHHRRSDDGQPYRHRGAAGGIAVFVDTGAGKGGHLSWIDLPAIEGS